MKSNIFIKVLGKTTIEIDESASEIIPKLCEQNGRCFEFDSEGRNFNFYCSKKGRIHVFRNAGYLDTPFRIGYRHAFERNEQDPYRIYGTVREANYKTIITLYSVKKRFSLAYIIAALVSAILLAVFYTVIHFNFTGEISGNILFYPALLIVTAFASAVYLNSKNKNYKGDLEAMKQAAIYRIKSTQAKEKEY